jgi:hypothetical protein
MRLFLILGTMLAVHTTDLFGQIDGKSAKDHVVIKYSPLPMFDFDNTIQFGAEIPFGNSGLTIQQDLGYGHASFGMWYRNRDNVPDKTTYKSRTHLRYYYLERRRVRGYLGAEFLYKRVIYRGSQWIGMDCSQSGGCNYFEQKDVTIGRIIGAGHARMGWQFYFSNRMTIDLFSGIGWRHIKVRAITAGLENARVTTPDEFWTNAGAGTDELVPSLVLGVHFGIVLGKFID